MQIAETNTEVLKNRFQRADESGLCPECGHQMKEVYRVSDDGIVFIWLQCGRDGCDGAWLQKRRCS